MKTLTWQLNFTILSEHEIMKRLLPAIVLVLILAVPASAEWLCVDKSEANLRRGPGTKYEKTWEVFQYMPFKRLSKKGKWFRVRDLDGDIHWVYAPLMSDKYRCAVVKNKFANVRTGPGTKYKQTGFSPVLRYYSFRVMKVQGDWVQIKDQDGDSGWIHRPLLWIPK